MTVPQPSGNVIPKVHPSPDAPLPRIVIENVTPQLDGGRYPVKRVQGDMCHVGADIYKDGHDLVRARLRVRRPGEQAWQILLMRYDFDSDRWLGEFELSKLGRWHYTIDAWADVFGTWRAALWTIFGLLAVAYPIGGATAVYVGAAVSDSTGSYVALVPIVLVAIGVWGISLWVAGPRRRERASRVAGPAPAVA